MSTPLHRHRRLRACSAVIVMANLQLLQGCKGVLDVSLPGKVPESALQNPALAPTLIAGVQADFECAFAEFVHGTGLWSNELWNTTANGEVIGWSQRTTSYDAGVLSCPNTAGAATTVGGSYTVYVPLQTARVQAENALTALNGFTDAQVAKRAELAATAATYAGFSYTLLGEAYCQVATGPEPLITPAAALAIAEQRFTRAIELATTAPNPKLLDAARVGRARARLDLKKFAEAAADAKLVSTANLPFLATYSIQPFRRVNTTALAEKTLLESVDPAYRNLMVSGVADSRVPVQSTGLTAQDANPASSPVWVQLKYAATDASMPIATWDEAQLIIAEADPTSAVSAINAVRTKYSLPAYTGTGALADIREERRRTLFLDGHRIGDMLRYGIPFATGQSQKGVPYGDQTCLPLPISETIGR